MYTGMRKGRVVSKDGGGRTETRARTARDKERKRWVVQASRPEGGRRETSGRNRRRCRGEELDG